MMNNVELSVEKVLAGLRQARQERILVAEDAIKKSKELIRSEFERILSEDLTKTALVGLEIGVLPSMPADLTTVYDTLITYLEAMGTPTVNSSELGKDYHALISGAKSIGKYLRHFEIVC